MLKRMHEDERGVAMVVAVMVSFIVLLLSIYIVQVSIHNSTQSAYDRKRVTSVEAAEAGLNNMWSILETKAPSKMACGTSLSGTLGSSPGTAAYTVTPTYYDANLAQITQCPLSDQVGAPNVPYWVLLTSVGTTNSGARRTMQSYASLTAQTAGLSAAILVNSGAIFQNSFNLTGYLGTDADIYVQNGDLSITQSPSVSGSIFVPNGSYSQSNNSVIRGGVWANGSLNMLSGTAQILGDATSSTAALTGTGSIGGNARAGTTIAGTLTIAGTKTPGSPQGAPPSQAFPYVCWTAVAGVCSAQAASWTAAGYTVQNYADCASAYAALKAGITGDVVVRINAVCNLSIALNDNINFTGNLAIITDGSITMANQNNWNGPVANPKKNLYFLVNYRSGLNCASGAYDITTGQNSNFNNVNASFYSPCKITFNNQNSLSGQIFAQTLDIKNNFTMAFVPVLIPGAAEKILGFKQSIVYIREVQ